MDITSASTRTGNSAMLHCQPVMHAFLLRGTVEKGTVPFSTFPHETNDFSPGETFLALEGRGDGMESGIGGYFRVRFPDNWPAELRYSFDWQELRSEPDPFRTIDYSTIT